MSAEKLQLPGFLLADFYKDHLVEIYETPTSNLTTKSEKASFKLKTATNLCKFLGENKRNIVIILKDDSATHINDVGLEFLTKILKACQLDLSDIAIVNVHEQAINYSDIKQQFKAKFILLFDVEPSSIKLPFTIPLFQVQRFADSEFLLAPSLTKLIEESPESKLLKSKMWVTLQKAFKLN